MGFCTRCIIRSIVGKFFKSLRTQKPGKKSAQCSESDQILIRVQKRCKKRCMSYYTVQGWANYLSPTRTYTLTPNPNPPHPEAHS